MKELPYVDQWTKVPASFYFTYACVWFVFPSGYIGCYFLAYGSFSPANERVVKSKIPFRLFKSFGED